MQFCYSPIESSISHCILATGFKLFHVSPNIFAPLYAFYTPPPDILCNSHFPTPPTIYSPTPALHKYQILDPRFTKRCNSFTSNPNSSSSCTPFIRGARPGLDPRIFGYLDEKLKLKVLQTTSGNVDLNDEISETPLLLLWKRRSRRNIISLMEQSVYCNLLVEFVDRLYFSFRNHPTFTFTFLCLSTSPSFAGPS